MNMVHAAIKTMKMIVVEVYLDALGLIINVFMLINVVYYLYQFAKIYYQMLY